MKNDTKNNLITTFEKINRIIAIIIATMIIAAGICFAISCILIYKTGGNRPFTYESIGTHFKYIVIPVLLAILSVICGGIFSLVYSTKEKTVSGISIFAKLKIARKKKFGNFDVFSEKEFKTRTVIYIIGSLVCLLFISASFIIAMAHKYTTEDINTHIANVCLISLPLALLGIATLYASYCLVSASFARELNVLSLETPAFVTNSENSIIKFGKIPSKAEDFYDKNEKIINNILRGVILILSLTFIVIGIFNGGMADVLGKAVRICTECIGLG